MYLPSLSARKHYRTERGFRYEKAMNNSLSLGYGVVVGMNVPVPTGVTVGRGFIACKAESS